MFAGSKVGLGVKVAGSPRTLPMARLPTPGEVWTLHQPERFFPSGRQQRFGVLQPNGQFKLDENRNLVNMQGLQLRVTRQPVRRRLFSKGRIRPNFDSEYPDGSENYHHGVDADNLNSSDPLPSVNAFDASNAEAITKKVR